MLSGVRVMVFLHGTAIMHATAVGRPRAQRVRQSRERSASVLDFASYVPTEAAVGKVRAWSGHGAQICYLSSHTAAADVQLDRQVLAAHRFTPGTVFFRSQGETYADVQVRMRDWYDSLLTDTVAVAHGGTARALMVSLGLETPASAAELYIEQGVVYVFRDGGLEKYS